jgi:lipopolysaccharide transport system ATP-binding protein
MASAASPPVIAIENLGKCYEIYAKPRDRLLQTLLRGRRKFYREFWALRDVTFDIGAGEKVGIVGRNGAGKSTLLQLIAGTLTPTVGRVTVRGRVAALLELGAGFNPEFSGRENVRLNAAILGLTEREIDDRFDAIAQFADIGAFLEQPVKTYSSGMYARLAFAVAAHVEPDVMIVDETLSVGDIKFQNKCLRKLVEFADRGTTILFVTHSVEMIKSFCDRAIWLHDGRLHLEGPPAEIGRRYVNFMIHGMLDGDLAALPRDDARTPKKAQSTETAPWVPITPANHVAGDPAVAFERVRFYRAMDHAAAAVLEEGDVDVVVEAEVRCRRAVARPLVAAGIFNARNEPGIHFNNANLGITLAPMAENSLTRLRYTFRMPSLQPGHYLLAIGIDDGVPGESEVLCHVYDALEVRRLPADRSRHLQAGYIELPGAMIVSEAVDADG